MGVGCGEDNIIAYREEREIYDSLDGEEEKVEREGEEMDDGMEEGEGEGEGEGEDSSCWSKCDSE